ncbi:MAG: hypothetical protein USCAAHI_00942 [Beijerinckiaceae bacterium]|nr:MAG: hypothetical protein USCAAHI_00942 [Beijerinckiaceae bacterium]
MEQKVEAAKSISFDQCAEDYIKAHRAAWKHPKHRQQWSNTLATYVSPIFGALPVAAIDTGLIMRVLEPIWTSKPETAGRLRGRIESILAWSSVRGYRTNPNPAQFKNHLDHLLPAKSKVHRVKHHLAMDYCEIAAFLGALEKQEGQPALALRFTILTACRTNEVLGAKWDEIDWPAKIWNIPAERMKPASGSVASRSYLHTGKPSKYRPGGISNLPTIDRNRFPFPRKQAWQAAKQYVYALALAPHGQKFYSPRFPLFIPRLGRKRNGTRKRNL